MCDDTVFDENGNKIKTQKWVRKYRIAPEYADCKDLEAALKKAEKAGKEER